MTLSARTVRLTLACAAALVVSASSIQAAPQEPAAPQDPAVPATSVDRIRERLETPIARPLTPSMPVRLRPVFKSGVETHPFVLTLDQDLHKTFDLNAYQRQSAEWASRCCGLDLGMLFDAVERAKRERLISKTRHEIARELAELAAARAAAGADK